MRRTIAWTAGLLASVLLAAATGAQPETQPPETDEPVRAVQEYNLPKKSTLAIKGYDPVAYFKEGGGEARKGKEAIALDHKGVTYRFASAEHRDLFKQNPARYEPTYGGWCAWAMARGDRADVDPKKFIVKDDRVFLFYDGFLNDTRAKWKRGDHEALTAAADRAWKEQTGEEPRLGGEKPPGAEQTPGGPEGETSDGEGETGG